QHGQRHFMSHEIPEQGLIAFVKVQPVLQEHRQVSTSRLRRGRVTLSFLSLERRVRSKHFDLESGNVKEPEGQRKITSETVVTDLRRETSEFPKSVEVNCVRIDSTLAQKIW